MLDGVINVTFEVYIRLLVRLGLALAEARGVSGETGTQWTNCIARSHAEVVCRLRGSGNHSCDSLQLLFQLKIITYTRCVFFSENPNAISHTVNLTLT